MISRKAQAAVEFLTTYGWAVLVIVAVLIALGWLGVFNIQQQAPDRCTFPLGTFTCKDVKIMWSEVTSAGHYDRLSLLVLRNDFKKSVTICDFACSAGKLNPETGWPVDERAGNIGCGGANKRLEPGQELAIDFIWFQACFDAAGRRDSFGLGSKYVGKLYLAYKVAGDDNVRVVVGDVVSTVQPYS